MGLDVTFMVMPYWAGLQTKEWGEPATTIGLWREYGFFGQMFDLTDRRGDAGERDDIPDSPHIETYPLPPNTKIVFRDEDGLKWTREDPYGSDLRWTYAKNLRELVISEKTNYLNRAAKAYVDELRDEEIVVIYIH